jgi:hypothetical protein
VDRMEKCLNGTEGFARAAVLGAYSRLVKSIFDALEAVAKEVSSEAKDLKNVDDKESLNIHILTIGKLFLYGIII